MYHFGEKITVAHMPLAFSHAGFTTTERSLDKRWFFSLVTWMSTTISVSHNW